MTTVTTSVKFEIGTESRVIGGHCGYAGNIYPGELEAWEDSGYKVWSESEVDHEYGVERRTWYRSYVGI